MPLHVACRADDADKHEKDVNQLLFCKGKLYSAGDDGKIKMWESDLRLVREVQAHSCSVFSLAASEDTLYSCSNDGSVKTFELDTLKEKKVLLEEKDVEFWRVRYDNGVVYVGDDQGNVRIYKKDGFYGSVNVAMPVKDLAIKDNLVFTAKDKDVIVTDLHLGGEHPQFGIKATVMGRGPLSVLDDKCIFMSREGKDIIVNEIGEQQHIKELTKLNGAHEMIINGVVTAKWNNSFLIFTGGWDKVVKQWKLDNNSIKSGETCNTEFIINFMTRGEEGQLYAAGGDGHIARLDV